MAWSFTDLPYGWKLAAGITLAGATIYVAGNTRWRINQADEIELALGVYERCLATQITTNPTYSVTPPSFVRSWYSNSYETTNVPGDLVTNWVAVLHTNVFTNSIGFRKDYTMMSNIDDILLGSLPSYYTTSPPGRYASLVPMTVTGIFAMLQIGDKTNKFTLTPVVGTNPATYGVHASRVGMTGLEERYRFINALENHIRIVTVNGSQYVAGSFRNTYIYWNDYTIYFRYAGPTYDPNPPALADGWTNLYSVLLEKPTASDLEGLAATYWGTIIGNTTIFYEMRHTMIDTLPAPWEGMSVDTRCQNHIGVNAMTNSSVGALKEHTYTTNGPTLEVTSSWYNYPNYPVQYDFAVRAHSSASLLVRSGTYYLSRTYNTNIIQSPEWMHGESLSNRVVVTILCAGSGEPIAGDVVLDGSSGGSWGDVSTNDSPYLACSNFVKNTLAVSMGDLDMPTTEGNKTNSPAYDFATIPYNIYFSEGTDEKYGVYFEDLLGAWHDAFQYCVNKYW